MIGAWATHRYIRFLLGAGALGVGFVATELFKSPSSFAFAMGIFAICLAVLVGAGKLASP